MAARHGSLDRCDQVVLAQEVKATEFSEDTNLSSHAEECVKFSPSKLS